MMNFTRRRFNDSMNSRQSRWFSTVVVERVRRVTDGLHGKETFLDGARLPLVGLRLVGCAHAPLASLHGWDRRAPRGGFVSSFTASSPRMSNARAASARVARMPVICAVILAACWSSSPIKLVASLNAT
jgi:hypothetical protein